MSWSVLVVAKAPVPGRVKTRLCPPLTADQAADLASAALLDTLALAERAVGGDHDRVILALEGELSQATRSAELVAAVSEWHVVAQRGRRFSDRLVHAHAEALRLRPGRSTVQIGMDTPHASAHALQQAGAGLASFDAVLGAAEDGGWWLLALRDPRAAGVLADVPMSRATTAAATARALGALGCSLGAAAPTHDIDEWPDALASASLEPHTRTAASVKRIAGTLV